MDFWKSLQVLKNRRWTLIGVAFLSFVAISLAPTTLQEQVPIYVSHAKILLTPPSGTVNAYGGSQAQTGSSVSDSWFADQVVLNELLTSQELLSRVLAKMDTNQQWYELATHIKVEHMSADWRGTKLFQFFVDSPDPKTSQKLARLITEEFVAYVQELSAREFASTRHFIEELVAEAEQRKIEAEEALENVREKYANSFPEEVLQSEQQSVEQIRQQAQRDITDLQAQLNAIRDFRDGRTSVPPWAILENRDGSLGAMEANVSALRLELEKLKTVYTDENEKVAAVSQQLAKAEDLYRQNVAEYVQSLHASKETLLAQKVAQSRSATEQLNTLLQSRMTPEDRRSVTTLERELSLWEENHLNLLQQLYQARVIEQSSRRQGSVNILQQPRIGELDRASLGKSRAFKLAVALPLCLAMGCGAAFLRDHLSTALKLRPRIEEALEVPVIAVIPSCRDSLILEWETFKRASSASPNGGIKEPDNTLKSLR